MTEAKLPRGLCWLSAAGEVTPQASLTIDVYNRTDRPLLIDAIYVDARWGFVTSIYFGGRERLAAPVSLVTIKKIGAPRLLPVLVVRGAKEIYPTMAVSVGVAMPLGSPWAEHVEVLIRCRDPQEIDQ